VVVVSGEWKLLGDDLVRPPSDNAYAGSGEGAGAANDLVGVFASELFEPAVSFGSGFFGLNASEDSSVEVNVG
jgi:hypothetical protein